MEFKWIVCREKPNPGKPLLGERLNRQLFHVEHGFQEEYVSKFNDHSLAKAAVSLFMADDGWLYGIESV